MAKMKPALFLHIQKTAGTAITEMAQACYGMENTVSHGDYVKLGRDGCKNYSFVSGHFGFQFASSFLQDRYSFTFLRDPAERLLSLYRFSRAQTESSQVYDAARGNSFEDFLLLGAQGDGGNRNFRQRLWNNQAWQLACGYGADSVSGRNRIEDYSPDEILSAAIMNLERFNYVGFVETFGDDAKVIFRALGKRGWKRVPRTNVSVGKSKLDDLPQSTKVLLKQMTEIDCELYNHARLTYGRRMASRFGWRRFIPSLSGTRAATV